MIETRATVDDLIDELGLHRCRIAARYACPTCGVPVEPFGLVIGQQDHVCCADCLIDEQRAATPAFAIGWADVRGKRDGLLAASDWTELPRPRARMPAELIEAWDSYRDALREITSRYASPAAVQWPAPPAG